RALLLHDGRGRLEGDAEVDRLAVGDASLHAARAIGARPHLVAFHVELVVVLRAAQIGAREARADLEGLARRQAQHRLGQIGLEAIEHGLAQPLGQPRTAQVTTPPSESPSRRAASTAAIMRSAGARSGQRIGVASTCSRVTFSTSHSTVRGETFETHATTVTFQRAARSLRATAPGPTRPAVSRALVRPPPRQSRKPYFAS